MFPLPDGFGGYVFFNANDSRCNRSWVRETDAWSEPEE
jgi:hypothetical protein